MAFQDIPRLYTGIAEWMAALGACFVIIGFPRDLKFWAKAVFFLLFQSTFLILTDDVPVALWVPCMCLAVFFMLIFIYSACRIPLITAGYYCAVSFLVAEFAASLNWQITYFVLSGFDTNGNHNILDDSVFHMAFSISLMLAIYVLVNLVMISLGRRMSSGDTVKDVSWQELVSTCLTAVFVFAFSNLSFILPGTPFSATYASDIFNVRTIIDLVGLTILYAHQTRIRQLHTEAELVQMNAVLKSQYEQYRNYLNSIEMINIKYHDLKHQLAGLRAEIDPEKRTEWIDRMSREVQAYKPEQETGNPVLNTMIAGKTLTMRNLHIQFTCVADGRLLGFMHVTDICSIFGNALDNAIECVALIPEPAKRLIHLQVSERQGFLFIMLSNYCETQMEFQNGMPVTTKTDVKNHGYGVKSIKKAVEKYGGNVTWTQHNDEFEMKALIPMPA